VDRRIPIASTAAPTLDLNAGDKLKHARFSLDKMDRTIDPRKDFVKFAAGSWYDTTPIPPDKSRWGGFDELAEANWARIRDVIDDATRHPGNDGSARQKVADFFRSAMHIDYINALGIAPIAAELTAIGTAPDRDELMRLAASLHLRLGNPFFNLAFFADQKKSDIYGFYLSQGGMSLPSKEYYFSPNFSAKRWEFVGHVAKMLELAGDSRAAAFTQAETVFALERALAENAKVPVDLRDRLANYHKTTLPEAIASYPGIPLQTLIRELGLPSNVDEIIIGQPAFVAGLATLLQERSLDDWKTYLRWHLLRAAAPYLSEPFERENFRFNGTVLNGTPEQEPRWQRAARAVDRSIGEALGQLYVEKYFPPAARARMMEMIANIKAVMRDRLATLDWMSEATRQRALAKFDRFAPMIGHPEKWRDYSSVEIKADDYYGNIIRATEFDSHRVIRRTGQKVDRSEWGMTPPTVNAYFSPTTNQIVFPAGILQPPFFHDDLDDAVNYGAIGAVVGHEITHGFDDQGRRYDADGNLTDWWTPTDAANFRERSQKLVNQFNGYMALPQLAINGQLSLGENIADLGGTSIAFEALQRSLRGQPTPPKIDGFTAEQRFYISWAQQWRTRYREDALRLQVARGPHAPGNFRAIGPLVNQQTFFDAFDIKPGDPMWRAPDERARIW
jgi:putative endopeptidase